MDRKRNKAFLILMFIFLFPMTAHALPSDVINKISHDLCMKRIGLHDGLGDSSYCAETIQDKVNGVMQFLNNQAQLPSQEMINDINKSEIEESWIRAKK